jgi:hypothetical protein
MLKKKCGYDGMAYISKDFVLKIVPSNSKEHEERTLIWKTASNMNIGPQIFDVQPAYKIFNGFTIREENGFLPKYEWSIIKMERLFPISTINSDNVFDLIKRISNTMMFHNDISLDNLMQDKHGSVLCIDWEDAYFLKIYTEDDIEKYMEVVTFHMLCLFQLKSMKYLEGKAKKFVEEMKPRLKIEFENPNSTLSFHIYNNVFRNKKPTRKDLESFVRTIF